MKTFEDFKARLASHFIRQREEMKRLEKSISGMYTGAITDLSAKLSTLSGLYDLSRNIGIAESIRSIVTPTDGILHTAALLSRYGGTASVLESVRKASEIPKFASGMFGITALIKTEIANFARMNTLLASLPTGISGILPNSDLTPMFSGLPDLAALQAQLQEMEQASNEMIASGYGFMVNRVSARFLIRVSRNRAEGRQVFIHRLFADLTYTPEFAARLQAAFCSHPILYEAWYVVGMAYQAHCERKQPLSITVFMTQTERLLTKLGEARGDIYEVNGTFYSSVPDKLGNPVKLSGLHNKMDAYRNHKDTPLADLIDFFLRNAASTERNPVLHGNRTDYGTEEMSVRWLWVLYFFACELQETLGVSGTLPN